MSRFRIPTLSNPDVVIRVAQDPEEIFAANRLVFRNYVADGFWEDDEDKLQTNKYLHTRARTVFIVLENEQLVGTMSAIQDSSIGLPSDGTQSDLMQKLRSSSSMVAEISAFAMERSKCSHRKLMLFLMSYVLQYCFYHTVVDRLVASCKPEHADFYQSVLCFSKVSGPTYYDYSHACGYLISLDLMEAHQLLSQKHPADSLTGASLYHFLLCDPQPCHRFPESARLNRPRAVDWAAAQGVRKVA